MLRKLHFREETETLNPRFGYACMIAIGAVLVLIVVGCTTVSPPQLRLRVPPDRQTQEEDIRETVFRYQMAHWYTNEEAHAFFLSLEEKDPQQALLQRFAGNNPPVKESSKSYFRKNPFPGWIRDRETGLRGALLSVGLISWLSPNRAEVEGGYYCGGLCAGGLTYELQLEKGKWAVKGAKLHWIS